MITHSLAHFNIFENYYFFYLNFSEFNSSMSDTSLKVSESDLGEAIKLASGVSIHFMNFGPKF